MLKMHFKVCRKSARELRESLEREWWGITYRALLNWLIFFKDEQNISHTDPYFIMEDLKF